MRFEGADHTTSNSNSDRAIMRFEAANHDDLQDGGEATTGIPGTQKK